MNKSLLAVALFGLTASTSAFAQFFHYGPWYGYGSTAPIGGETVLIADMNNNGVVSVSGLRQMHDAVVIRKVKKNEKSNKWTKENSFSAINQSGRYVPIGYLSTLEKADHNNDGLVTRREARCNKPQIGLGWLTPQGIYVSRVDSGMPISIQDTRYRTLPAD